MAPLYPSLSALGQIPSSKAIKVGQPGLVPGVVVNAEAWFRADQGVTDTGDGTAITAWADQSGKGWNLVTGTSPTWRASVVALNNKSSAEFTHASNTWLKNTTFSAFNSIAGLSAVMIVDPPNASDNQVFVSAAAGFGIQVSAYGAYVFGGDFASFGNIAFSIAAPSVVSLVYNGSLTGNANRLKFYVNGVQQELTFTGTVPATTSSSNGLALGTYYPTPTGTFNAGGQLPETILYSRVLGASERAAVESYLETKYGVSNPVSNAVAWYRADLGATAPASGSAITTWVDESSNHWDQTPPATAPVWTASVAAVNNKPSATYDRAVPRYLTNTSFNSFNGASGATFIGVLKPVNTSDNQCIIFPPNAVGFGAQINANVLYLYGDSGLASYGTINYVSTALALFTLIYDGTQTGNANRLKFYLNGVQQTLTFTGTIDPTLGTGTGLMLGGVYDFPGVAAFSGEFPEAILYARALGSSEQTSVESYLRTKYGTP